MCEVALRDFGNESEIASALIRDGTCMVEMGPQFAAVCTRAYRQADLFFKEDLASKERFSSPSFLYGFRAFGRQYSVTPDRPDLNESFTYWGDDPRWIPQHTLIGDFLNSLHEYWFFAESLATLVVRNIERHYTYPHRLNIRPSSYIETNWYNREAERDLLQDRHEDGHLLTLVNANAPGLEVERGSEMVPVSFEKSTILVMTGGLLAQLTGSQVASTYHQVRNHRLPQRASILYLVNPPIGSALEPLVSDATTRGIDFARVTREIGTDFGLPIADDAENLP